MRTSSDIGSGEGNHCSAQNNSPTRRDCGCGPGKIHVVGLGPGEEDQITPRVMQVLKEADVIVGYKTYINLITQFLDSTTEVISSGMRKEVERATQAVEIAKEGKKVVVVSSGDPGIYGMAGVVLPLALKACVEVEVVAGVTAAGAAAALLGAPLMNDFAVISLSDILTPWEKICRRVEKAAEADFVLVLYNPKSKQRTWQLEEVRNLILKYRKPATPVGIARNIGRPGEEKVIATLDNFLTHTIDMFSTVIVGNSESYALKDKIIVPRGYQGC